MAGLQAETPIPTNILLHQQSRTLELVYGENERYTLSHEYLRVFTPSAEARGHGPGQETLQVGKREVFIERLEVAGNYALKPVFSDGHESGLYSWDLLHNLAVHQEALWQEYLLQLEKQGASRDPLPATSNAPAGKSACAHKKV